MAAAAGHPGREAADSEYVIHRAQHPSAKARLCGVPGAVAYGADRGCAGVCFPAQLHSGTGTKPPPPHAVHRSFPLMAASSPMASPGSHHPIGAITARSGSSQGLGPKDFQDALAVPKLAAREDVRHRKRGRPKDLGTLDGSHGGLIFLRRVKATAVSPMLVVLPQDRPLMPYRRRITIRRQSSGGPLQPPRSSGTG